MSYRKAFVSVDLETTHLDPRDGKIIEVAAQEAAVFYNEKTGLHGLKVGPLSYCLTIVVLLASVVALLGWVAVKTIRFVVEGIFCPGGVDKKVIIKK